MNLSPPLYLIGFTGQAGAGKDSSARALARHGYKTIAFADAVRAELAQAFRLDAGLFSDRRTKELPLPSLAIGQACDPAFLHWAVFTGHSLHEPRSPRWLMQQWGTEFRRRQDPDYWARIVEHWVRRQASMHFRRLAITDVRMPNEAAMIRELGGKVLQVHNPDLPTLAEDTARHESERHQLPVDGVIHNDASLDALVLEVERVVRDVCGAAALSESTHA